MSDTNQYIANTYAARILDATTAGRSMLTAADAAAQRELLSVLSTAEIVAAYQPLGDYATGAEGDLATSAVQPSDLATVATSGSYNDLTDKPTIPTAIATGTITPRDDDINLSGGSIGDVITVQADGSLALSTPAGGSPGGSPGGSSGQMQFNDGGAFGGTTAVVYAASDAPHVTITAQSTSFSAQKIVMATGMSGPVWEVFDWAGNRKVSVDNTYLQLGAAHRLRFGTTTEVYGSLTIASNVLDLIQDGMRRYNLRPTGACFATNVTSPEACVHIVPRSMSQTGLLVRNIVSGTGYLTEYQTSAGALLSAVRGDGSTKPPALVDASAANDSIYYSTDAGKLVYKDSTGTVNNLY
jgi:hypothetical protein